MTCCLRQSGAFLVGVIDLDLHGSGILDTPRRLGFADHNGEHYRRATTAKGDILLELEAELGVVSVVGLGARFEVHRAVFSVGLVG